MSDKPASHNDPRVVMTITDLENIRSYAASLQRELDPRKLKMDESQFRTYCYVMGTQAWLRSRDLLKIILD
jgi:hypothetical protein